LALSATLFAGGGAAQAQGAPGGGWSPAAGAVGDNTYQGYIDHPASGATIPAGSAFQVSGWIVDTTAQGWAGIDDVQVLLGSQVLGHLGVGQSRPDVGAALNNPFYANSGFSGTISGALPSGNQTLTIVAHTPDKGSWSKTVPVTVTGTAGTLMNANPGATSGLVLRVISPTSSDVIPPNSGQAIFGVAYDTRTRPELGTGVDRVSAYLDGPRGTAGSQNLGDATFNGTNWSINWDPGHWANVKHRNLWVYARSSVTGEEVLWQQEINLSS
jgi:hypothetical protein